MLVVDTVVCERFSKIAEHGARLAE